MEMTNQHVDVLIVGAGLSGIGAGYHLQHNCPGKSYVILEGRETIGGTSGSPIIHAETYEVIGINNTGNENGGKCTLNNPCEVDEQGNITVTKGASYGQQLFQIYTCLNDQGQFDLTVEGCKLPGAKAN